MVMACHNYPIAAGLASLWLYDCRPLAALLVLLDPAQLVAGLLDTWSYEFSQTFGMKGCGGDATIAPSSGTVLLLPRKVLASSAAQNFRPS